LVKFVADAAGVELQYTSDRPGNGWVWRELRDHGGVTISRMFTFEPGDLVVDPGKREEESDYDDFVYRFRFAARRGDYLAIPGRIFDIPNPVMIAAAGVRLERKTFADERNISVLGAIADLLAPDQPIIIGGPRPDAIPVPDYEALLRKFPNTGEMNRYAAARVATVVGDYIQPLMDAREQYERYLTRRHSSVPDRPLDQLAVMRPRSISTSISATSPNALGNCQSGSVGNRPVVVDGRAERRSCKQSFHIGHSALFQIAIRSDFPTGTLSAAPIHGAAAAHGRGIPITRG
jgi:hypothetical protein